MNYDFGEEVIKWGDFFVGFWVNLNIKFKG